VTAPGSDLVELLTVPDTRSAAGPGLPPPQPPDIRRVVVHALAVALVRKYRGA
jgi:hypothetical protein